MAAAAGEGADSSEAAGLVEAGACAGLPQAGALGAAGLVAGTAVGAGAVASAAAGVDVFCSDGAAEVGVDDAGVATAPFA